MPYAAQNIATHCVAGFLLTLGVAGCGVQEPRAQAKSTDDPHYTDSLYKLVHLQITVADPAPVYQQYVCAFERLRQRVGAVDATRRVEVMMDTVFKTSTERDAYTHLGNKLANHGFRIDDEQCGPGTQTHYPPSPPTDSIRPPTAAKP